MIGIIQRVLVDMTRERAGEPAAEALVADVGRPAGFAYRLDRDYPDEECLRLFARAGELMGLGGEALMDAYAEAFLRQVRSLFPVFFQISGSARDLLLRQPAIHTSLGAGLRDEGSRRAVCDKFQVAEDGNDLVVTYSSPNRLCALYKALAHRLLADYGERGEADCETCQHDGAPACRIRIKLHG